MANRSASVRQGPAPCRSVVPAGTPRRYLRYPVEAQTSMVPVCRRLYRAVAAHQCVLRRDLQRVGAAFACTVTVRRHILQYKLAVVSRSSAALFNEDTNTWLKVKWLYCKCSADRPTINSLTHSECHTHQRQLLLSGA